jgi:transposase
VDHPDEPVQVFPETCADCGAGLADGADAGVSSRQVFDVPPVTVGVTEYMLYKKQCRCGCVTTATPPAGVADAPVCYGPNLQAFVAYLLVFQHVPVHRAAMLIADLTGARPSTGFVHGILRRCAHALGEVMTLVKTLVTRATVPARTPSSYPADRCWNVCATGKTICSGSVPTPGSGRPTTSVSATCGR